MANLGFPTRRRMWIFVALAALPLALLVYGVISDISAAISPTAIVTYPPMPVGFIQTSSGIYVDVWPNGSQPSQGQILLGEAAITIHQLGGRWNQDRGEQLVSTCTYTVTWNTPRPTDAQIDAFEKAWNTSDHARAHLQWGGLFGPVPFGEALKTGQGTRTVRNWPAIIRQVALQSLLRFACVFASLPIVYVPLYLAMAIARRTPPRDRCWSCGYSTRGLTASICPECGADPAKPPA